MVQVQLLEKLKFRKKYKKIKWTKPIKGPWIHQNIMETIKNIKSKRKLQAVKKQMNLMVFMQHYPLFTKSITR